MMASSSTLKADQILSSKLGNLSLSVDKREVEELSDTLSFKRADEVLSAAGTSGDLSVSIPLVQEIPLFTAHNRLGSFSISKMKYSSPCAHSKLIPEETFPSLIGTDLNRGFNKAILQNPGLAWKMTKLKHKCFVQWLVERRYLSTNYPNFVCFNGRITDSMMKDKCGSWEVYGTKVQDLIYLFDEKRKRHVDIKSYYGIHFEHIVTEHRLGSVPNDLEKTFDIREAWLGNHKLVLLSEIDAEDENGELVEIKICGKKGFPSKIKVWGQSVVAGINKFVIGKRNDNGVLQDIAIMTMDKIVGNTNIQECLEFENRFLCYVKAHMDKVEDGKTKLFTYSGRGQPIITRDAQCPDWLAQELRKLRS